MNSAHLLRVLIVDDVADLRRVVRGVLEDDGRFVVAGEAEDGFEAVDLAAETQPDLVLLDLDMPRMSGLDVLPTLRTVAPSARVVVLSGLPPDLMAEPSRSAGAVGFLPKGVRARQLVSELLELTGLLEVVDEALAERNVVVGPELTAPRAARRLVTATLAEWECESERGVVELLVSELVTNAVMHARSAVDVAVVLHRDVVRIEVGDQSPDMPVARRPPSGAPSGRGIELVSQLASAWGVAPRPHGKLVWFEVPRRIVPADEVIIE